MFELGQPSPVDPRKRFSLGCQPLYSKRMLRAYSSVLGCPTHGSPRFLANLAALAPHLQHHTKLPVQEVTLSSRVLSQCRRRMSHTFCPCQLRLRSPTRWALVTRSAAPLSPAAPQDMRTRQNRCRTFPSFIFLVPSLRECDHVWPSLSSFHSEDETANVADDCLARFDSSFVRVAQDLLEGGQHTLLLWQVRLTVRCQQP